MGFHCEAALVYGEKHRMPGCLHSRKKKKQDYQERQCWILIPALGKAEAGRSAFKASLVYIESCRPARVR